MNNYFIITIKTATVLFGGFFLFLGGVHLVNAAAITSTQTGDFDDTATWVGGAVPGDGDTAIIAAGHTVTVTTDTTVGATSGTAAGIEIQGTDASTYGSLVVNSGATLTLKGVDADTYPALLIDRYAKFLPASGSTVLVDATSDYQTAIVDNGYLVADGVTFGIPTDNITWSNTSGNQVLSNVSAIVMDSDNNIYAIKAVKSSASDVGPISNAAGDGLGSFGDSSFSIVSSDTLTTAVSSYNNLATAGDYYVDHAKGIIYYKSDEVVVSLTYNYKYGTWFSSGIIATNAVSYSSILIDNSTFNYWGSNDDTVQGHEYLGGAIIATDKYALGLSNDDRAVRFTGNTFNYCTRAIQVHSGTADADHKIQITGNTFNNCRYNNSYVFGDGLINIGYTSYINISSNTFNTFTPVFNSLGRGTNVGLDIKNNTGTVIDSPNFPEHTYNSYYQSNTITGFGGLTDNGGFQQSGDSSNGSLYYLDNSIARGNRAVRLGSYMVVQRNKFSKMYHHGIVFTPADGYITGAVLTNNVVYYSDRDMGGGWTLGYNRKQWIDDIIVANNTFDNGIRGINFNDGENTIVLGTRLKIFNNIISNSDQGIYRPADDGSNITKLSLTRLDYNVDYSNATTPTNVKQATFTMGSAEYNTNGSRNALGVNLFQPSYTLPMSTSKSLAVVVSGTSGTNKSVTLSWAGGATQELVQSQGTATGGTTSTLIDSGKSWTDDAFQAMYVKIISGTGSGQVAMIKTNTATTLTVIKNSDDGTWTAPDATSVYVIFNSEVTLSDGVNTVHAGIYLPDLVLTNATYTDSGITIVSHAQSTNPIYTSASTGNFETSGLGSAKSHGLSTDAPTVDITNTARPSSIDIGAYNSTVLSTAALITSFTFASPAATGTINNTDHTVALTVPYGTSVSSLTPTIAVSSGATISPTSGSAQNFTSSVTYTVTAEDTVTTQAYTVTVTVAANSSSGGGSSSSGGGGGGGLPLGALNPPTIPTGGFGMTLNNNNPTTSERVVPLTFSVGPDVNRVAISFSGTFDDASLETYQPTLQLDLCSRFGGRLVESTCPAGVYTVYGKFYTQYGQSSDTLMRTITLVTAGSVQPPVVPPVSTPTGVLTSPFTKNLKPGSIDPEVKLLQQFLNTHGFLIAQQGVGSSGHETTIFGPLTTVALTTFQTAHPETLAEKGSLGPLTRAVLNEIEKSSTPETPQTPISTQTFNVNLYQGTTSADVRRLQSYLASQPNLYPEAIVSGYFGPLTKTAVQRFQLAYQIVRSPADTGYGSVGPATRAKLNELMGR